MIEFGRKFETWCIICGEKVGRIIFPDPLSFRWYTPVARGCLEVLESREIVHLLGEEVHHGIYTRDTGGEIVFIGKPRLGVYTRGPGIAPALRYKGIESRLGLYS